MARITLRQLLDHAAEHGYGVPAFNINNMEQGLAIMEAAKATDARSSSRPRAAPAATPTTSCWRK
jgi:fructose/tagatose bisphosphate aldolase